MSVVLEARLEKNKTRMRKSFDVKMCSPPDIESHEGDPDPHDDEERLESNVVTDGLHGHPLHQAHVVVLL